MLMVVENAAGECYVYGPSGEYNTTIGSDMGEFSLPEGAAGGVLIYEYKLKNKANKTHYVTPQYKTENDEWYDSWRDLSSVNTKSSDWSSTSINIPSDAVKIKFYASADFGGAQRVYIRNVKVTRVSFANAPASSQLVLGPKIINSQASTASTTMEWSNISPFTWEITGTNASQFSVNIETNAVADGCSHGTAKIIVTYKHDKIAPQHTATLKIKTNKGDYNINLSGTTLDKYTATFQWGLANTYLIDDKGDLVGIYSLTDNNGNDIKTQFHNSIIFTSSAPNIVSIENGQIIAKNAGKATITAYFAGNNEWYGFTKTIELTINKHTPVFTWNGESVNVNQSVLYNTHYDNYFQSSSTKNLENMQFTYSSSNTEVATLSTGDAARNLDLTVFNKPSTITLTASQTENWYWYAKSETHTIIPKYEDNHVPFTMNTKDLRVALYEDHEKSNGSNSCDDGGTISLNQDGGIAVWTANPLYYTIKFSGIPDKLTFKYKMTSTATAIGDTKKAFIVYESTNGTNWNELWTTDGMPSNTDYKEVSNIQLNPDTRYLKFFYDGTYTGYYSGITVTELNVFEADPTSLDFGAHQVDKTSYPTKTFALHYANAGYKVKLQSTNDKFIVSPTEINTIGGEHYGTYAPITVKYNTSKEHNTDNTGKIIITDECGHQTEVELNGSTYKIPQSLYWTENWQAREPAINVNSTATDLARATSTLEVRYTSSDESIIQVINGTTIHALREGRATITAYQDGTEDWAQAESISKEFIVTNKIIQYIHWTDNLLRLLTTDEPFALNATIQLADTEGNRTDSPERTAKIKYYSNNPDIVSVEGNILTIQGAGETYVVAYEEGDKEYEQVYLVMPVRVRIPSTGCDPKVLEEETEISFFQMNTNEIIKDAIEIDRTKGIPGKLSFQHKGEKWISIFYTGSIKAQQSTDNGNNWSDIDGSSITPTVNEYKELANLALDERATHIRFVRSSGGQGYHYVKDIEITPAQYIRSNTYKIDFGETVIGSDETKPFAISYSNMQSEFHMVTSHTDLTLSNSIMVDDCGAWGEETHTVRFKPTSAGAFNETIIVYDDISQLSCTIQVVANIIKGGQDIVWNPLANELRESNDWRSGHTKNAYSTVGLDITYTMQPNAYAHFDANGHLVIDQTGGSITITASQAGNDNFNEATSVSKTFNIPADLSPLTFIGGHAENDWSNTLNWNYNRLPKETESILLQAPAQLTTNATVSGITLADDPSKEIGSIHIKPTGGLTIGNNGIIGANADGSSIVIDNTPEGAGFLRISPDYNGTMPYFTMRYQTKSTLDYGANKDATWQYIGAPGEDCSIYVDHNMWLYLMDEKTKDGWVLQDRNASVALQPFAGYAITQYGQPTYEWTAQLTNANYTLPLTYTKSGRSGRHIFANSYTAPIDIKALDGQITGDEDHFRIEKTIYIFNSGSWNQWNNASQNGDTPGQYYAIPISAAAKGYIPEQTVIPPMQGFYMRVRSKTPLNELGDTEEVGTVVLDYNQLIMGDGHIDMHTPMRTPQRFDPINNAAFKRIRIHATSANSGADRLYVIQDTICTSKYDNGYDATNQATSGLVNIYTNESAGKMEVSCSNNMDSIYIGFMAGEDSQYTLHFGAECGNIYLKDLENDSIFRMQEGEPYHFTAVPNSTNDLRFQILLYPQLDYQRPEIGEEDKIVTNVTDIPTTQIWSDGNYIYIANAPIDSTVRVYTISGYLLSTIALDHMPYTLDLSHLTAGVYMIQVNNQVYKFICK